MHNIVIGTKAEKRVLVTAENAISFLGAEGPRVLATPNMIGLMERACRDTVLPQLETGYDTVGTHVNVFHLAAAPIGATVNITAEITEVVERRVEFRVEAWDEKEKIGEGTHQRAIINVAKFAARMAEKQTAGEPGSRVSRRREEMSRRFSTQQAGLPAPRRYQLKIEGTGRKLPGAGRWTGTTSFTPPVCWW
jgi:predicted thioesterase